MNSLYYNPYSILYFVASFLSVILGSIVYINNKSSKLNRIFLVFCLFIVGWTLPYALELSTKNHSFATLMSKIGCSSVLFCSPVFYHFTLEFIPRNNEKIFVYAAYIFYCITTILTFTTDLILTNAKELFFGYYGSAGPFYFVDVAIFFLIMLRALVLLIHASNDPSLSYKKKTQAKYMSLAFIVAYVAGIDFMPKYGIAIYPFGPAFTIFWMLIIAYTIIKHQLMDFRVAVKKGLVYTFLAAAITFFLLISAIIIENLFQFFLGYQGILFSLISATIIAFSFVPIKNTIQHFVDVTFFKATPIEIAEQNEQLRQEVSQTEKYKAAAALASGIAHEVKNPVTAFKTFAEHLPEKKNDPEFLEKWAKILDNESERVNQLIHNLLDFSKPSPLKREPCSVDQILEETLGLVSGDIKKNNITVRKELTTGDCRLNLDRNQMKQAFLNIIQNAIEAMPCGGMLTITTSEIRGTRDERRVEITISDTGKGIPKDKLKHIFDPFYTDKDGGTGLGLAITKQIIEKHGGNIIIQSNANIGTMTTLIL